MKSFSSAPARVAFWMLGLAFACGFLGGAGQDTVFDPLADFAQTLWMGIGWIAVIIALATLVWLAVSAWRKGGFGPGHSA